MSEQTKVKEKKKQRKTIKPEDKRPCLIMTEGDYLGEIYPLNKETFIIGRSEDADITVVESGVSRRHAMIENKADAFVLCDLGSTNGTEINGVAVEQAELKDGDKIYLGGVAFKFCYQDEIDNEYHKQLRNLAIKDGLTRIFNKRYFLETLEKEFIYSVRHQIPLSVVIFDIDFFKKLNDTYGHPAGDFVLRRIATTIERGIRGYDIFARYGGEEFVFLLRGLTQEVAIAFAERIRQLVEQTEFNFNEKTLRTTISVGVATFDSDNTFDTDEQLVASADQYLYRAKDAGRNCVGNLKPKD